MALEKLSKAIADVGGKEFNFKSDTSGEYSFTYKFNDKLLGGKFKPTPEYPLKDWDKELAANVLTLKNRKKN